MPAKARRKVGLNVIYFDLETTGFNGQICSMAFLSSEGGSKFTKFLIPTCSFNPRASMINKMNVLDGKLYQNGKIVETAVPIEKGLEHFVDWLTQLNKNYGKIVLVSGNYTAVNIFYLKILHYHAISTTIGHILKSSLMS